MGRRPVRACTCVSTAPQEGSARPRAGRARPRAILLLAFQYDAPAFTVPAAAGAVVQAMAQGLELWQARSAELRAPGLLLDTRPAEPGAAQVNLRIDSWGVQYARHFQITAQGLVTP